MQEIVNIQDQISTDEENAALTQMFVKGKFSLKTLFCLIFICNCFKIQIFRAFDQFIIFYLRYLSNFIKIIWSLTLPFYLIVCSQLDN